MSASRQQRCKRVAITSLDWHRSAAEGWLEESFALGCGRQPEPVKAECAARLATGGLGGVLGQTPGLHSAWELGRKTLRADPKPVPVQCSTAVTSLQLKKPDTSSCDCCALCRRRKIPATPFVSHRDALAGQNGTLQQLPDGSL